MISGALAKIGFAGENQSAFHDMLVSPQRFTQAVIVLRQLFSR